MGVSFLDNEPVHDVFVAIFDPRKVDMSTYSTTVTWSCDLSSQKFSMATTHSLESVRTLLEEDLTSELGTVYTDIIKKIRLHHVCSQSQLYNLLTVSKTVRRNITVECDIPDSARTGCIALLSESSGNCLFSTASIAMCGDNSLSYDLRLLTAIELYLNSDFYSSHPYFVSLSAENSEVFRNIDNLLSMCVSFDSIDTGKRGKELVKEEAKYTCKNFNWSSFLCILGLTSVCSSKVQCFYKSIGTQARYRLLFNTVISPRSLPCSSSEKINILLCYEGEDIPIPFKHNHYVPLLFISSNKRKLSGGSKPSLKNKINNNVTKEEQSVLNFFLKKDSRISPVTTVSSVSFPSFSSAGLSKTSFSSTKLHTNLTKHSGSTSSNIFSFFPQATTSFSDASSTFPLNFPSTSSTTAASAFPTNTSLPNIRNVSSTLTEKKSVNNYLKYDVATYYLKAPNLTDGDRKDLITNVFIPGEHYKFPKHKTNSRSFKFEWLKQYPWLCYSPSEDGAYCLSCVLLGFQRPNKASRVKNLLSQPFRHWPDAIPTFNRHCLGKKKQIDTSHKPTQTLHFETWPVLNAIIANIKGSTVEIDITIDRNLKKEVAENRAKLKPIVDTVILLGRIGVAYRGHRDDSQYHSDVGSYSGSGVGNFVEILNYRVRGGDTVLENHLRNCSKNATYISKTSQNEVINCCGKYIKDVLVKEIKLNKFFSIIADEASDCSNKEQMSLVLRFIDQSCEVREEFMGFLHCNLGLTGLALSQTVLTAISNLTLDIQDCRGQGYDGAAAVSGHKNGLSAHILRLNDKALYTHCHSHRLNLVISHSCEIQLVRNVMQQIKDLSYFFNFSPVRQQILEAIISDYSDDTDITSTKKKLTDVCRTRWVERITGLDDFEDLYVPIVLTLEKMSLNVDKKSNRDTSLKATSYLKLIASFDFIVALVITRSILDMTLPVTELLQAKAVDISDSVKLISALKRLISSKRSSVDEHHEKWYEKVLLLSEKVNVPEAKPRTAALQRNRSNVPFESVSDYFKKSITIPFLDHINTELNSRFDHKSVMTYNGLVIIPSKLVSLVDKQEDWKTKFFKFAELFKDDLPCYTALDGELELWQKYWVFENLCRPDNISDTLKSINFKSFSNVKVCLRILGTLPVTSCSCERTFSAMKRLKDYRRSTMGQERLNGIALMHIHEEIVPDIEKVIDMYAEKNRRINFV